jgi:hypothetical protein
MIYLETGIHIKYSMGTVLSVNGPASTHGWQGFGYLCLSIVSAELPSP